MKEIKSYVPRGRATQAQQQALENAGEKLLCLNKPLQEQWRWASGRKLCVELGCGSGENLLQMAAQEPEHAFIGVDVYTPGLGKLLARAGDLANMRVLKGDHQDLFSGCIATPEIDLLMLFFPDPWPKTRHHKRRLINRQLLDLLRERLTPSGELWIATDWHNYAEQIIALFAAQPAWQPVFTPPPLQRAVTAFERKALAAPRGIFEHRWRLASHEQ